MPESTSSTTERVGFSSTESTTSDESRKQCRRAQKECHRREIFRHVGLNAVQPLSAADTHAVAVAKHLSAECLDRQFGVIAGAHRLNDRGLAFGEQARQQHATFTWALATGGSYSVAFNLAP